jgi:hypothetical protein
MKIRTSVLIIGILIMAFLCCCRHVQKTDRDKALKEFRKQVDETLPAVVSLTGIQMSDPVKIEMLTRGELGKFFENTMEIEYPNGELRKRGQCFAEIGLLPQGYDLSAGFVKLLKEQAGAIYDQHSKTLKGVSDLPTEQKRAVNDRMIISHELVHALQDRIIDIKKQSDAGLRNIDYEYAVRALLEGMASSVQLAYGQNLPYNKLPDVQSFWRSNLARATGGTLAQSPQYLTEYLISPYAEGGAFVQAWQKANSGKTLKDLLGKIPASSEQVLHFKKYVEADEPTDIDLKHVHKILPKDWKLLYANILGEFDLLILFKMYKGTQNNAVELSTGWDGCRFEAYERKNGDRILFGSSIWDSEKDANEFSNGFNTVLKESRTRGDYEVVQKKTMVNFVTGSSDGNQRSAILKSLSETH